MPVGWDICSTRPRLPSRAEMHVGHEDSTSPSPPALLDPHAPGPPSLPPPLYLLPEPPCRLPRWTCVRAEPLLRMRWLSPPAPNPASRCRLGRARASRGCWKWSRRCCAVDCSPWTCLCPTPRWGRPWGVGSSNSAVAHLIDMAVRRSRAALHAGASGGRSSPTGIRAECPVPGRRNPAAGRRPSLAASTASRQRRCWRRGWQRGRDWRRTPTHRP